MEISHRLFEKILYTDNSFEKREGGGNLHSRVYMQERLCTRLFLRRISRLAPSTAQLFPFRFYL